MLPYSNHFSVEITAWGPVDPKTGMAMNITDYQKYMGLVIMKNIDHKSFDKNVD